MAARMTRSEAWSHCDFVLTNATSAVKGELACFDLSTAGEVCPGKVDTDLLPIGYFDEDLTGDGTKRVRVRLFREKRLHWWDNDGANAVAASDIGSNCWIKDAKTVSALSTGRSVAGVVWGVSTTYGVLVDMAG